MAKNEQTTRIIDGLLQVVITTGMMAAAVVLPGLMAVLDKPTADYLRKLDKLSREKEVERLMTYMLQQKLLTRHYQHGVRLTQKGKTRLKKADFNTLRIAQPKRWDHTWRLVMFDIPNELSPERRLFTHKIRLLGFQPLQQSVWVHPFACKEAIAAVAVEYRVAKYVTYIETSHIDHENKLIQRFSHLLTK